MFCSLHCTDTQYSEWISASKYFSNHRVKILNVLFIVPNGVPFISGYDYCSNKRSCYLLLYNTITTTIDVGQVGYYIVCRASSQIHRSYKKQADPYWQVIQRAGRPLNRRVALYCIIVRVPMKRSAAGIQGRRSSRRESSMGMRKYCETGRKEGCGLQRLTLKT